MAVASKRCLAVLLSAASLTLAACGGGGSQTHVYYIAADEVDWDYTPSGRNLVSGQPWTTIAKAFIDAGPGQLGHVTRKAIYREYTDASFKTLKPRPPEWEHLGILGPLIRAEVGDTIRVIFRNNSTFPASMHPHGVFYLKDSEGAPYSDSTSRRDKADDGVPTGGTHTYTWAVPERAGPTAHEGSSVFWMYHSHVHEVKDVNAGLMGPMIITARGAAKADGTPKDVDRELVVAFFEVDESSTHFTEHNARTYAKATGKVVKIDTVFGVHVFGRFDRNFRESINGMLYGNTPGLRMKVGERVRWYLMANTNFEMHSPHWHGNTVVIHQMRTDVTSLTPMEMATADMVPDDPGTWLFHCHTAPHLMMGMEALYHVDR